MKNLKSRKISNLRFSISSKMDKFLVIFLAFSVSSGFALNAQITAESSSSMMANLDGRVVTYGYSTSLAPDGQIHYVKMSNGKTETGVLNGTMKSNDLKSFYEEYFPIVLQTYKEQEDTLTSLRDVIRASVDKYLKHYENLFRNLEN